ncbi:MAG: hypothetical protein KDA84_03050, partial [Planctomycetaceae bacterium]|nr:hypothetical protein [Planctomycetaceae bacterium]
YAMAFAARLPQTSSKAAIEEAYRLAFARKPTNQEAVLMAAFLKQQKAIYQKQKIKNPQQAALIDLCQALMGMNEFIYIE